MRVGAKQLSNRMSVDEYRRLQGKRAQVKGAVATVEDGIRFQSKLEARRYRYWWNLWQIGAIEWFVRQVPFRLPGGIIWRADFLVVHSAMGGTKDSPNVTVEDCKGWLTEVSRNKIKQVEAIYGITVQIVKSGDF